MYVRFYQLLLLLFITTAVNAQQSAGSSVPQMFSYSSQIRDANRELIVDRFIKLRFTIHSETLNGPVVYWQIDTATTSPAGIFTVVIGGGSISNSGTFGSIPWQLGDKYLQVEVDADGGDNFVDMGASQLLSFPYSITAGNGLTSVNHDSTGAIVIKTASSQIVTSNTTSWLTSGNQVNNTNNFIGTTDNIDFVLKRMSAEGLRLKENNAVSIPGKLGIGAASASPVTSLDIDGGLTLRDTTVNVSGNFTLNPGNRSLIFINSAVSTGNATLTMGNGLQRGQIVILSITGSSSSKGITIKNQAIPYNTRINSDGRGVNSAIGDGIPYTEGNSITLLWNGTDWTELSSSITKP